MSTSSIITFLSLIFCFSCNSQSEVKPSDFFEKSYKEQKRNGLLKDKEHFDEIKNIYSNYYYHIAFNGPDNWETDNGTADNIIYRSYDPKYGITFSIGVMERKSKWEDKTTWDFHNRDRLAHIQKMKNETQRVLKTEVSDLVFDKIFIKNNVSTKTSFSYTIKNLDNEYLYKSIQHQVYIEKFLFTFALQLPMVVYKSDINFYDNLFNKITFLPNDKRI